MTDNNYEQDLKYIDEQGVIQYDELGVIYCKYCALFQQYIFLINFFFVFLNLKPMINAR